VNDHQLRDAYDRVLRERDRENPTTGIPAERVSALVEGTGSEAERLRTLDVLMSSAEGRRELDLAWAAVRAARTSVRSSPVVRRGQWLMAAASVVLVAGTSIWLATRVRLDEAQVYRGADSPVQLVLPRDEPVTPQDLRFVWRPVDKARDYTLVVVDTAGNEVYAAVTEDSALVLPDSVALAPGRSYLWWVQAALTDGSTLTAVTEQFRVKGSP
jgi:hypothetical protein